MSSKKKKTKVDIKKELLDVHIYIAFTWILIGVSMIIQPIERLSEGAKMGLGWSMIAIGFCAIISFVLLRQRRNEVNDDVV